MSVFLARLMRDSYVMSYCGVRERRNIKKPKERKMTLILCLPPWFMCLFQLKGTLGCFTMAIKTCLTESRMKTAEEQQAIKLTDWWLWHQMISDIRWDKKIKTFLISHFVADTCSETQTFVLRSTFSSWSGWCSVHPSKEVCECVCVT